MATMEMGTMGVKMGVELILLTMEDTAKNENNRREMTQLSSSLGRKKKRTGLVIVAAVLKV